LRLPSCSRQSGEANVARKTKFPCRHSVNLPEWLSLAYEDMAKRSGMDVVEVMRIDLTTAGAARGYHAPQMPIANGRDEARA